MPDSGSNALLVEGQQDARPRMEGRRDATGGGTYSLSSMTSVVAPVVNGAPQFSDTQKRLLMDEYRRNEGKDVRVQIGPYQNKRTTRQNSYLWGVVYAEIAADTGYSTEDIHEAMKAKFLPRNFVDIGNEEIRVPKSTTTLSTDEFGKYVDQIVAFAGELGIAIPPPNGQ